MSSLGYIELCPSRAHILEILYREPVLFLKLREKKMLKKKGILYINPQEWQFLHVTPLECRSVGAICFKLGKGLSISSLNNHSEVIISLPTWSFKALSKDAWLINGVLGLTSGSVRPHAHHSSFPSSQPRNGHEISKIDPNLPLRKQAVSSRTQVPAGGGF
jgi:hypothetical protein